MLKSVFVGCLNIF